MKLVLAEKLSVAQSIAKVLGANKREDGYLDLRSGTEYDALYEAAIAAFKQEPFNKKLNWDISGSVSHVNLLCCY